jgi:two-component system, NtrC family, nitrogen regulation response regulator GlnG
MAGKSPADDTTLRPRGRAIARPVIGTWLTVLWHPSAGRIGEVALLPEKLSRLEPDFTTPGGAGTPLGDPHVSRKPVVLATHGARLRISAPAEAELLVDGAAGGADLDEAALASGVVLELADRVALLVHRRTAPLGGEQHGLVGESEAIERLRAEIARIAELDAPVLVSGETGAGKERVARALHEASGRAEGPFVAVNMATLGVGTAASALFGHARGAFTGADRAHVGLFEQADGGTLFLDEIGDTAAEVQAMLLRVLETGEVTPLGGEGTRRVDVRLIAASDADLTADGALRAQLYHRLAGHRIAVPPLRTRLDDLGRLLVSFVARELASLDASERLAEPGWLPTAAIRAYARHAWPGNVRELANLARHLAAIGRSGPIALGDAVAPLGQPQVKSVAVAPQPITDEVLIASLAAHGWRTSATALALGISRTTLYALMDRCPQIRKARDLAAPEITACRQTQAGDLDRMAEVLRVSKRGLQLRMRELGMA